MRRFGPFFLETRLAVGGTAEVYVARPAEARGDLPERLVVKRLLPHMLNEPDARTMFEREAKLHAASGTMASTSTGMPTPSPGTCSDEISMRPWRMSRTVASSVCR